MVHSLLRAALLTVVRINVLYDIGQPMHHIFMVMCVMHGVHPIRARPDWAYEFMAGQDWTPNFAGQVLPDQTKSGLIFLNIYIPSTGYQKIEKNKFWIFFFFIFKSVQEGKRPVS